MSDHERRKLAVPKDLYEKIGNKESIMKLIKLGLLSLRATSLEKEITKLTEKIERSRKRIKELPSEVERMEAYLRGMIEDRKILETILTEKR